MERSEQIGDLITALAKAQLKFGAATKDSNNPFYGSKYADLSAVIGAVRPALNEQGIAVMHFLESDLERQVSIVTVGLYCGEQFIRETVESPAVGKGKDGLPKFDVQTLGAAWTYLRRYTLQAICSLASEDDDGNSLQNDNKPIVKRQTIASEVDRQKAGHIPAVSPKEETDWKAAVDNCKSPEDVTALVKIAKAREYPEAMRRQLATKATNLGLAWNGHTSAFEPKNTEAA